MQSRGHHPGGGCLFYWEGIAGMAWEVKPYPEWSWSHSRDLLFRECQRKYYYQYYGSHNGWLQEAAPEAARLYRLKQLQSLYLLFGDVVHQMADMFIGRWERDKVAFSEDELLSRVRNLMNQAVKNGGRRRSGKRCCSKCTIFVNCQPQ